MIKEPVIIQSIEDLGARVTAEIVQAANEYDSQIFIEIGTKKINAKSIMGMMSLQLTNGDELEVVADGSDEEEAVKRMKNLFINQK